MLPLLRRFCDFEIRFTVPVFGLGCGVLGMTLARPSAKLGRWAGKLLRSLEYRGYDSTGAVFQDGSRITLLKDIGAPSTLVETLGIEKQGGKLFCGQVRWATFGAVDRVNAQPHEVKCKRHLYGAHNGNITNTRELKNFLIFESHNVLSDNDGEMLVHLIEHYFDNELDMVDDPADHDMRRTAMRKAIVRACKKAVGSFAAVITDPVTQYQYAIKAGSSLYFGVGETDGIPFAVASSDLTAVLRFTKMLVKLREGEFIEYTADGYRIYAYKDAVIRKLNQPDVVYKSGQEIERTPIRSKLRAEDTELLPQFEYFLDQEINAQAESAGKLVKIFLGGSNTGRRMLNLLNREKMLADLRSLVDAIDAADNFPSQQALFDKWVKTARATEFHRKVKTEYKSIYDVLVQENFEKLYFFSNDKNTYIDLIGGKFDKKRLLVAKALDSIREKDDILEFDASVKDFSNLVRNTLRNNRNIYTVACGTSFHATKVAAVFFNQIAGVEIIPILPGDFRGQYSRSLKANDVIIGVSQSGETKDLIDVFNDIDALQLDIKKIVLVNNMNSTLGQEKSDVSIPIFCGPEIAVPATKSFINQLTLFYYLAIKAAEAQYEELKTDTKKNATHLARLDKEVSRRYKTLLDIPQLIRETIESTTEGVELVAAKAYMEPSMQVLATKITGVAKEGALKIRETVLNHTEGSEASEFKHGPNTILGKNTVFGMKSIKALIKYFHKTIEDIQKGAAEMELDHEVTQEIIKALSSYVFTRTFPFNLPREGAVLFKQVVRRYDFFNPLYRNYPLIYVTGPDERDVNLTISQINTHKIRGADTFVIAEENDKLLENAAAAPSNDKYYGWAYITLPKTGDSLMTVFSATVVLQLLALRMSVRKMAYLDRLNIIDHGVHPDVPKNVSKSITVD
ncbi:MAG: SIS domain-containing protein [Candidatus Cloacimonetes bacterium]|nr:SIS domain-containing protein [Candidatus Cloacimonadota bacterium]